VYLVHESADGRRAVLATDVETVDSLAGKTRGLMFRESLPEGYALVFRFDRSLVERVAGRLPHPFSGLATLARRRSIHMLFVRVPLDVVWLDDGEVVQVRRLRPWRDTAAAPADTVVELPAGAADDVEPGDRVTFEQSLAGGVVRDWRSRRRHRRRSDGRGSGRRRNRETRDRAAGGRASGERTGRGRSGRGQGSAGPRRHPSP
jgi:uncharacterized membrane protein (UPF0127 family)